MLILDCVDVRILRATTGRTGVGLSMGLENAIDFSPSSLFPIGSEVAERCFSSKSLTSFAAGAIDVSSFVGALCKGEIKLFECCRPSL